MLVLWTDRLYTRTRYRPSHDLYGVVVSTGPGVSAADTFTSGPVNGMLPDLNTDEQLSGSDSVPQPVWSTALVGHAPPGGYLAGDGWVGCRCYMCREIFFGETEKR